MEELEDRWEEVRQSLDGDLHCVDAQVPRLACSSPYSPSQSRSIQL